jgi:hypothetical protein
VTESEARTPVDQALDLLVYAPIGLLFDGAELLPQLVQRGKSQVTMARMVGRFAVDRGRTEATKAAGKLQDQAAGVLDFVGASMLPVTDDPPVEPVEAPVPPAPTAPPPRAARAAAPPVDDGALELAIPDYDGLSASQVVNRLAGLAPGELEAVRAYEAAKRGRKTILSKVAQLQAG